MPINAYLEELESPVLMIHGEKAHSRYFSESAYQRLRGNNKEIMIIPGAVRRSVFALPRGGRLSGE